MTSEFKPVDSDVSGSGISWAVSGKVLEWFVDGLSLFQDNRLRFSPTANRLSLHGESDCPGHPLRAGALVGMTTLVLALIELLAVTAVGVASSAAVGTVLSIPLFGLFLTLSGLFFLSVNGLGDRMQGMEFIDHTTPKPDDRIKELADGYVDGDLDREEFAQEVETVFEREAD
jgi:hypothetical protein